MTEAKLERWILQANRGSERIIHFRTYMKRFVTVSSSRDLVVKWAEVMGSVLVTHDSAFGRVRGLKIEDWTRP